MPMVSAVRKQGLLKFTPSFKSLLMRGTMTNQGDNHTEGHNVSSVFLRAFEICIFAIMTFTLLQQLRG